MIDIEKINSYSIADGMGYIGRVKEILLHIKTACEISYAFSSRDDLARAIVEMAGDAYRQCENIQHTEKVKDDTAIYLRNIFGCLDD